MNHFTIVHTWVVTRQLYELLKKPVRLENDMWVCVCMCVEVVVVNFPQSTQGGQEEWQLTIQQSICDRP